jgi:hypothetical protein
MSGFGTDLNVFSTQGTPTDDYLVEGYLDLSAMQTGDIVIVKEWISVGPTNLLKIFAISTRQDAQTGADSTHTPIFRFHTKTLGNNQVYQVTAQQTNGTLRTFYMRFIQSQLAVV